MNLIVFSLDPGSKQTGWAVLASDEKLLEAGLLLPNRVRDEAAVRLMAMRKDLITLLDKHRPSIIVIEWTSGKVNRNRHGGAGAGLAIYGVAVGALWQVCEYWAEAHRQAGHPCAVALVPENQWTMGRPKQNTPGGRAAISRVDLIERRFPQYVPEHDPGGDVADAIGVNLWFQRNQRMLGLPPGQPKES